MISPKDKSEPWEAVGGSAGPIRRRQSREHRPFASANDIWGKASVSGRVNHMVAFIN